MRSPVLALTWQLWRPQRWFWVGMGLYTLILAVVCNLLLRGEVAQMVGAGGLMPLGYSAVIGIAFLALVTGGASDLGKNSGFPSWMFTLPVRTQCMVAWVMLNGTFGLVMAFVAISCLILRPSGFDPPWWLAFIAPTILAWIQVLSWTPFTFSIVRLLLMITILTVVSMLPPLLAYFYEVRAAIIMSSQLVLIAIAYPLAGYGVVRARRGDAAEPRWLPRWVAQLAEWQPRRQRPFRSASDAQLWYEWSRNGVFFLQILGCLLVCFGLIAAYRHFLILDQPDEDPWFELISMAAMLILPAGLMSSGLGKADSRSGNPAFPSFLATRPIATTDFVVAKWRMVVRIAFIACLMGILGVFACLPVHGNFQLVKGLWDQGLQHYPAEKAWTLLFFSPVLLFLVTCKNLTQGMWIGLTGRPWVGFALMAASFAGLIISALIGAGLYYYPQYRDRAWAAVPWLAGLVVLIKVWGAVWVLRKLHQRRLVPIRLLTRLVILWFLAVGVLFGLGLWFVPAGLISAFWLAVGCVYSVPFTHFALAPLALEWNRHR